MFTMLIVVMLSVVVLNFVMLNFVMLNVVVSFKNTNNSCMYSKSM